MLLMFCSSFIHNHLFARVSCYFFLVCTVCRSTIKDAVAVIQSGCYEGRDEIFSHGECDRGSDRAMFFSWKKAVFT